MGTRKETACKSVFCQDHPHACGDKIFCVKGFRVDVGSSPRVWGQGPLNAGIFQERGIIPTRVGTSKLDMRIRSIIMDHPHACGDKSITVAEIVP